MILRHRQESCARQVKRERASHPDRRRERLIRERRAAIVVQKEKSPSPGQWPPGPRSWLVLPSAEAPILNAARLRGSRPNKKTPRPARAAEQECDSSNAGGELSGRLRKAAVR